MYLPTQRHHNATKTAPLGINFQLAVQLWTGCLTSLGPTFFIYKVKKNKM